MSYGYGPGGSMPPMQTHHHHPIQQHHHQQQQQPVYHPQQHQPPQQQQYGMHAAMPAPPAPPLPQPSNLPWGRVIIAGGTNWPKLGKKEPMDENRPDLLDPHILRSLSNVKAVSVHSSPASAHFVVIDIYGTAFLFGRNTHGCLGVNEVEISEWAPVRLRVEDLPGHYPGSRFVHAATGRYHTLLVASTGEVWACGQNHVGQCGRPPSPIVPFFAKIPLFGTSHDEGKKRAIKATAGITFSGVLTDDGEVYTFGSGEYGQLGNGRTGEYIVSSGKTGFDIESDPVRVRFEKPHKIVQLASSHQHSIALDEEGHVYVWGYNAYCRLGTGNQVDSLKPKLATQFQGPNKQLMGAWVSAGPSNTSVIDGNGMFWIAGKWKTTGEGSSGSPYTTFRYLPELQGCKATQSIHGGVTHFILTPDDAGTPDAKERTMIVSWGQAAINGELGLGEGMTKSQTKPDRSKTLAGIDVLDVAAGQNTTLFLCKPNEGERWSELIRHPEVLPNVPDACVGCQRVLSDEVDTLECEKCDTPYHLHCLNPPLTSVPEGEWFCPRCSQPGWEGAPIGGVRQATRANRNGTGPPTTPGRKRKVAGAGDEGGAGDGGDGKRARVQ
ncbi:regulator of chromosome condensation 1/beta-lactamase-inhibitor protein II [Flagelloscypha sp. PMI_526]|nr:regulator of chromosome condensation 1/beta-lactamase-inhibitor protein II [Flagelloscypha sp. PMI_526]